jgi:hypothetical protein
MLEGKCPVITTGTGREKLVKKTLKYNICSGSTVVEHLSHNPMVEGSSPVTNTGTRREKLVKNFEI